MRIGSKYRLADIEKLSRHRLLFGPGAMSIASDPETGHQDVRCVISILFRKSTLGSTKATKTPGVYIENYACSQD
jgi:hypothetical protein